MSSTKTQSRRFTASLLCKQYKTPQNGGPGTPALFPFSKVIVGDGVVTYGDNLPDWKWRIRHHMSATTTLVATSTLNVQLETGFTYNKVGYPYPIYTEEGNLFARHSSIPSASSTMDVTAERKAASKFLSHYIKHTNTWRGGNFLAEMRETWHMLHNPVKSFYHRTWEFAGTMKKLGKVQRHARKYVPDMIADAWLAFGFGVKPLISDANDAASALNKIKEEMGGTGQDSTMVSGYGDNKTYSKTQFLVATGAGFPSQNNYAINHLVEHRTVRYRAALKAHLEDLTTVAQAFGVDKFDIIPAVWEAIPWSFFIDYFANVGEMLDSCRLAAAEVAWCNRTVRNSAARTIGDMWNVPIGNDISHIVGKPRFFALARYVNRTPSSIPQPSFHFKVPGLASTAWLNIAALSQQVLSSRPTFK